MLCGAIFLASLVYLRSCLVVLWTNELAGVPLVGLRVLWLGKWYLFVSFGQFGKSETIGVLRIWKALCVRAGVPSLFVVFLVFVDRGLSFPFVSFFLKSQ